MKNKLDWPKDFGDATVILPYETLRKHRMFNAAKAGDFLAADRVINDFVKDSDIDWMQKKYPAARVVAVQAEETTGKNQLPNAFAIRIAEANNFSHDDDIIQINKPQRRGKDAMYRLLNKAIFAGNVFEGENYILVDDVITQGGTLNELRKYIQGKGGLVVHAAALSGGIQKSTGTPSKVLKIRQETIDMLYAKFGSVLDEFLNFYGIGASVKELTESEAFYLFGFNNLFDVKRKMDETPRI